MSSAGLTEKTSKDYKIQQKDIKLLSKEEVEVVLKVSPLREGNIVLDKITWELYNSFKFEYDFVRSPNM